MSGDVVRMVADDLLAPRIRAEDRIANALVLHNQLSRSTDLNAQEVASLIVWGVTFDFEAGSTRWSELYRTCRQLHRPEVLATRDDVLQFAAEPQPLTPPVGWAALAPAERIGVQHLADANQIRAEGRRMEHCVGSYAGRVMTGGCDLFHIADADGGATLEVIEEWCVAIR